MIKHFPVMVRNFTQLSSSAPAERSQKKVGMTIVLDYPYSEIPPEQKSNQVLDDIHKYLIWLEL